MKLAIEKALIKEGFIVKNNRKKKKIDIRKKGFDEDIKIEDRGLILVVEYLKDITHNLTIKNIKRTLKLMIDLFRWMRKK